MTIDIFVSHSSSDEELARAVAALLREALHLRAASVRCTSAAGHKLSAGANVDEILRREVLSCKVLVAILTPASLDSRYVMFELGARWGAGKSLMPIFARGLTARALGAPLDRLHAVSATDTAAVYQLVSDVAAVLRQTPERPETYDHCVRKVVDLAGAGDIAFSPLKPKQGAGNAESRTSVLAENVEWIAEEARLAAGECDDIYVVPRIPKRILKNAQQRFLRSDDHVIAFINNSHAGTDGAAILPTGVRWRNTHRDAPTFMTWRELAKQHIRAEGTADCVLIGKSDLLDTSGSDADPSIVAKLLRDVARRAV